MPINRSYPAINPSSGMATGVVQTGRKSRSDEIAEEIKTIFPQGIMGLLGRNFMKSALGTAGGAASTANPRSASGAVPDDLTGTGPKLPATALERGSSGGNAGGGGGQSERRSPLATSGQEPAAERAPSRHDILAMRRQQAAEIVRQAEQRDRPSRLESMPGSGVAFRGVLKPRSPGAGLPSAPSTARVALSDPKEAPPQPPDRLASREMPATERRPAPGERAAPGGRSSST